MNNGHMSVNEMCQEWTVTTEHSGNQEGGGGTWFGPLLCFNIFVFIV